MSVLVTGGLGYIGSHTCVELMNAGFDVVVVDNLYNCKKSSYDRIKALVGKDFPFYQVDIRDKEGMQKVFDAEDIDSVIHFAGLKAVGESCVKPLEYFDNNITGTLVLLDVMRNNGCKKIVFSSSATVYGMNNISPLTEDMQVGGVTNPYGRTNTSLNVCSKTFMQATTTGASACFVTSTQSAHTRAAQWAKIQTEFQTTLCHTSLKLLSAREKNSAYSVTITTLMTAQV